MTFEMPKRVDEVLVITGPNTHTFMKAGQYYYTTDALRDVLEQAAQEATDTVAFNGGTVQMEAHVREAIRKMIGEIK